MFIINQKGIVEKIKDIYKFNNKVYYKKKWEMQYNIKLTHPPKQNLS
jgi:hypothetical protein